MKNNNKKNTLILGISAYYHDSAAVLIKDEKIVAAAQEERFTRIKNDPAFPVNSIKFCLEYGGIELADLDAVVFYEKPFTKFERLLETYYVFAPKGLKSYLSSMPVWLKEKLFLKKLIKDELKKLGMQNNRVPLLFSEHHLSHAASAFYSSPFLNSAILTIDGVGEWATATIAHGKGNKVIPLKELKFPHSVGLLYSAFTYYLGFKVNSGEYKLMGLAPYGDPKSKKLEKYISLIKEHIVHIKEDGSIWLNQEYFNYASGLEMVNVSKWKDLFGFGRRDEESELEQKHCDLALAIQQVTEEIVFAMARTAKELTNEKYLCIAGGVALNCVATGKLLKSNLFSDIWVQPAAGDAGGALGAAHAAYFMHFNNKRTVKSKVDLMEGSYLGPEFGDLEIETLAKKSHAKYTYYADFSLLCNKVAEYLDKGHVVGWFQGRMEWGPRALGNRSILADPRNKDMQKKLNLKIKYREGFRPFAPAVLSEDAGKYFDIDRPSPYMMLVTEVAKKRQKPLPKNYHQLSVREKLYFVRSDIPSVTHLDFSARLQTVHKETNQRFWQLLNTFKKKTNTGVLVNTSFNVRGEPIVCTPEEAYTCFMKTEMDYLVIGNFLFEKDSQMKYDKKYTSLERSTLD